MATLAPNTKTADDYWQEINNASRDGVQQVVKAKQIMEGLKAQVKNGERGLTSFYSIAEQLMPRVHTLYNKIAGSGSRAATAVNNAGGYQLMQDFTQRDSAGQLQVKLPFTRTEYASLKDEVLPSREDVNGGFWDPTIAPIERYKAATPTAPATPTPPTTPVPQPNPGPTPTAPPVTPTTPTTPTAPITPSDPLPSADQTTTTPYGGLRPEPTPGGIDAQKLLAEAEMAKKLQQETLDMQVSARKKMLDDLSQTLLTNQNQAFQRSIPTLAEHANTQGIYRSTGFGEKLAGEYSNLTQKTMEQLAMQGLSDREKAIDPMMGIETDYLGGRNAAIGRQFSLDDHARNVQIAKELGASSAPTVPGKTTEQKWASGISAGASVAGAGKKPA